MKSLLHLRLRFLVQFYGYLFYSLPFSLSPPLTHFPFILSLLLLLKPSSTSHVLPFFNPFCFLTPFTLQPFPPLPPLPPSAPPPFSKHYSTSHVLLHSLTLPYPLQPTSSPSFTLCLPHLHSLPQHLLHFPSTTIPSKYFFTFTLPAFSHLSNHNLPLPHSHPASLHPTSSLIPALGASHRHSRTPGPPSCSTGHYANLFFSRQVSFQRRQPLLLALCITRLSYGQAGGRCERDGVLRCLH